METGLLLLTCVLCGIQSLPVERSHDASPSGSDFDASGHRDAEYDWKDPVPDVQDSRKHYSKDGTGILYYNNSSKILIY